MTLNLFNGNQEDLDNREAIRQPKEAADNAIAVIEERINNKENIKTGFFDIPEIDPFIRKPMPGDLISICGRPRNGKSFIAKKLILNETLKIHEKGPSNKCTICITWEEPAEVLAMNWMAFLSGISSTKMLRGDITRQEFDKLNNVVSLKVGTYPIYIIGGSMKRLDDGTRRLADLTLKGVDRALTWIINKQTKDPQLLSGDYIQRVPNDRSLDMKIHVMNVNNWFKNLSLMGIPVIQVTQAKQEIEDRDIPMPGLNDSEWSSSVGQASDFFIGTTMLKTKYDEGTMMSKYHKYNGFRVTKDLMFIKIDKQKHDEDGFVFPLQIKPDLLKWRVHDMYYGSQYASDMQQSKPAKEIWY